MYIVREVPCVRTEITLYALCACFRFKIAKMSYDGFFITVGKGNVSAFVLFDKTRLIKFLKSFDYVLISSS